jgi:hypothetical protein
MTDDINTNTSASAAGNSAPCPTMELPPELRQIIYDFYLEDRKLPRVPKLGAYIDPFNRIEIRTTGPLGKDFGLLHCSSGVRAENALAIYKALFTGVWLLCGQPCNQPTSFSGVDGMVEFRAS